MKQCVCVFVCAWLNHRFSVCMYSCNYSGWASCAFVRVCVQVCVVASSYSCDKNATYVSLLQRHSPPTPIPPSPDGTVASLTHTHTHSSVQLLVCVCECLSVDAGDVCYCRSSTESFTKNNQKQTLFCPPKPPEVLAPPPSYHSVASAKNWNSGWQFWTVLFGFMWMMEAFSRTLSTSVYRFGANGHWASSVVFVVVVCWGFWRQTWLVDVFFFSLFLFLYMQMFCTNQEQPPLMCPV